MASIGLYAGVSISRGRKRRSGRTTRRRYTVSRKRYVRRRRR